MMLKKKYYTGLQIHEAIDGVVGDYQKAIEIYRRLAKMETDDVAPVVRCKDCRWKEQEEPGMVYCPATVGGWVDEDWFCKSGERSEQISAEFAKLMREGEIQVRWRDGET